MIDYLATAKIGSKQILHIPDEVMSSLDAERGDSIAFIKNGGNIVVSLVKQEEIKEMYMKKFKQSQD